MDKDKSAGLSGVRIADRQIYSGDDPTQAQPKEYFKLISQRIAAHKSLLKGSCADVGCAHGALIAHLQRCFPHMTFAGFDVTPELIASARHFMPQHRFETASILDPAALPANSFDVVVCAGTVQIFDDLTPPLENLIQMVRSGGILLLMTLANTRDVDLITRYRRTGEDDGPWEMGWNIYSRKTYARILSASKAVKSIEWHPFQMPFALPEQDDPMRSWTIAADGNPFQLVNGVGLMLDPVLIEVSFH